MATYTMDAATIKKNNRLTDIVRLHGQWAQKKKTGGSAMRGKCETCGKENATIKQSLGKMCCSVCASIRSHAKSRPDFVIESVRDFHGDEFFPGAPCPSDNDDLVEANEHLAEVLRDVEEERDRLSDEVKRKREELDLLADQLRNVMGERDDIAVDVQLLRSKTEELKAKLIDSEDEIRQLQDDNLELIEQGAPVQGDLMVADPAPGRMINVNLLLSDRALLEAVNLIATAVR